MGIGCGTVAEHMPHDQEVVGLNPPGCLAYSINDVIKQEKLLLPTFMFQIIIKIMKICQCVIRREIKQKEAGIGPVKKVL